MFTAVPALSSPSVVREIVSGTTSKESPLSFATTVRHAPLIETESPRPASISVWTISRAPSKDATRPRSRTIPVNIGDRVRLDQQVVAEPRRGHVFERERHVADPARPGAG